MTRKEYMLVFVVIGLVTLAVGFIVDSQFAIGYGIAKLISALYFVLLGVKNV